VSVPAETKSSLGPANNFVLLWLETACSTLAALALSAALASMSAQIVARYVVGSSLFWSEEVARYSLIWSVMIGSAVAYRKGMHAGVTILVESLPRPLSMLVYGIAHAVVLCFSLLLTWQGVMLTLRNFERNQLTPALQIPIAWIYLAIPVGALLIAGAALIGLLQRAPTTRQGA
jgi:TRAP-type C4-dicarboxylate transport system permease small subunit